MRTTSLTDYYFEKQAVAPLAAALIGMGISGLASGAASAVTAPSGEGMSAFGKGFVSGAPWGLIPGVGGAAANAARLTARTGAKGLMSSAGRGYVQKGFMKPMGVKSQLGWGGLTAGIGLATGGSDKMTDQVPEGRPYFNTNATPMYATPQYGQ